MAHCLVTTDKGFRPDAHGGTWLSRRPCFATKAAAMKAAKARRRVIGSDYSVHVVEMSRVVERSLRGNKKRRR